MFIALTCDNIYNSNSKVGVLKTQLNCIIDKCIPFNKNVSLYLFFI